MIVSKMNIKYPTLREVEEYYLRDDFVEFLLETSDRRVIVMSLCNEPSFDLAEYAKPLSFLNIKEARKFIKKRFGEFFGKVNIDKTILTDIPSFHLRGDVINGTGFDYRVEQDEATWHKSFSKMSPILQLLDSEGLFYRLKYSGNVSLHLLIPSEVLPKRIGNKSLSELWPRMESVLQGIFKESGLKEAGGAGMIRMPYSFNENSGLISLPIHRNELMDFHPMQAIPGNIRINNSWWEIPTDGIIRWTDFINRALNGKIKHSTKKALAMPLRNPDCRPAWHLDDIEEQINRARTVKELRRWLESPMVRARFTATRLLWERFGIKPSNKLLKDRWINKRIKAYLNNKKIISISENPDLITVTGGIFLAGAGPWFEKHIDKFVIDRDLVTNKRFKSFIADGGYNNPKWWDKEGWKFIKLYKISAPISLSKQASKKIQKDDMPVAGLSWFEARAYAKWEGRRLPKELEWEKAARGCDGRPWPWGEEFNPAFANTQESKNSGITPVGKFNKGKSPYGCRDMVGNLWEWTMDEPVVRGGSWNTSRGMSNVMFRVKIDPRTRYPAKYGFRCANL